MKRRVTLIKEKEFGCNVLGYALDSNFDYTELSYENNTNDLFQLIQNVEPDIILLCHKKNYACFDIINGLKSCNTTRYLPIIFLSTSNEREIKLTAWNLGVNAFFELPISKIDLETRIKSLLRIKSYHDELESSSNLLISLVYALEAKDPYSKQHSHRTSQYATALANAISTDVTFVENIRIASLLHDIGKIGINDMMLQKPTSLNYDEYEIIKKHPVVGEKICSSIKGFRPILPWIKHHHENWDGKGYPDKLKGEDIPFGARIIAIADAFDAMSNDRPYRQAMELKEVCNIFKNGAGKQWDAQLINVFFKLIEEKKVFPEK